MPTKGLQINYKKTHESVMKNLSYAALRTFLLKKNYYATPFQLLLLKFFSHSKYKIAVILNTHLNNITDNNLHRIFLTSQTNTLP